MSLAALDGRVFDVVVIGGGIIGASSAREAAAAGHSVLLVEKDDFASGATSRSSRLLHCGLRYFEAPNPVRHFARHPHRLVTALRMARQAMRARHEIVTTSGARTTPLDFHFPIYDDGPYAPWQADLAFHVLGSMAPKDVPLDYRRLALSEALEIPIVAALGRRDRLLSVARFTEYQFDWPERLCIDAVLDAEALGAVALNATIATLGGVLGDARAVALRDRDGGTAEVRARRVLAMAGAWIDQVLQGARADVPRKVLGTKGAHIVVRLPDAYRRQGITTVNSAGEPFYCIAWHDLHYIGPTETVHDGDPDEVRTDAADLDFILAETAALFPGLGIGRESVLGTWAGIRPLTHDPVHSKGNRARRLHDLAADGLPGVYAMTAGPVMTHRDAGREVAARLASDLPPSGAAATLRYAPHLPEENSNTLPLAGGVPGYAQADIRTAVTREHASDLMGVLYRRSGIGWRHRFTDDELSRAADTMAAALRWSPERRAAEIARFRAETERLFGIPGGCAAADAATMPPTAGANAGESLHGGPP